MQLVLYLPVWLYYFSLFFLSPFYFACLSRFCNLLFLIKFQYSQHQISSQYSIQKIFTELQTILQNKKVNKNIIFVIVIKKQVFLKSLHYKDIIGRYLARQYPVVFSKTFFEVKLSFFLKIRRFWSRWILPFLQFNISRLRDVNEIVL